VRFSRRFTEDDKELISDLDAGKEPFLWSHGNSTASKFILKLFKDEKAWF
jgi:hypothetical protein